MKLTPNFSLKEFAVSNDHPDLAIYAKETLFSDKVLINTTKLLCESILQPISYLINQLAMFILSGYRDDALNSAVGGSPKSDHCFASAVDFTTKNLRKLFELIVSLNLPYRQLIYYPDQNFIHISINIPGRPYKHEAFVKYKKNKHYLPYDGKKFPVA